MTPRWLWRPSEEQILTTRFMRNRALYETLADVVVPELRARRGRPLRILVWAASTGCEVYTLRGLLRTDDVDQIHGADVSPTAVERAREGRYPSASWQSLVEPGRSLLTDVEKGRWLCEPGDETAAVAEELRQGVRFLSADLFARHPGVAEGCYDIVVCNNLLLHLHPESAVEAIGRLQGFLRGNGVLVLSGCHPLARAQAAHRHGLEPWPVNLEAIRDGWDGVAGAWFREPRQPWAWPPVAADDPHYVVKTCEIFRAAGPLPPPRLEDLLGRRAIAVAGMPRAGTTFVCEMVRAYGACRGLFVTPLGWRSPLRLEEGLRLDAIANDPTSTAADLAALLDETARWFKLPEDLGLCCKLPHLIWRPDLLRSFSAVALTVRPLDSWLQSAMHYRDTVMHAVTPAAWLPAPVQERIRARWDGPFLAEFGACNLEQVEQLAEVLDVDTRVFRYGEPASMRAVFELMRLPADEILVAQWTGPRRRPAMAATP